MSEVHGNTEIRMSSERSFGIVFSVVFLIVALFPLISSNEIRWWAVAVAAGFGLVTILKADLLRPLNRLWFRFGVLLSKIVSPIVMGILFFLTVTPVGLIMRVWNRDLLRQKIDPEAESYWIAVDPEKSANSSMKQQF